MKTWKTVAVAAAVTAVAIAAVVAPPVRGQTRVTPKVRALEMLSGGSRIGVSIRDVEESDSKKNRRRPVSSSRRSPPRVPAEKAGIRKGDAIVEFDGERVRA